jgi:excisionase family DNA binding protein
MADMDEFWTAEEVSTYLHIPQSTIYKFAQEKVLPGFKVGKHWRFRRESILD